MKFLIFPLSCLMTGLSGLATATDAPRPFDDKPAAMLYFHKALGEAFQQRDRPLAFGLRLQRDFQPQSSSWERHVVKKPAVLLDYRYSLTGRSTLVSGGALMYDSADESSASFGAYPFLKYSLIGLGILAGLCATETWICEDDDNDATTPGYVPPTGE
ncbi:MAG TPA: hypothetical protein P5528_09620 [Steroidobacteraceae bacterium]|nr:hypothetical protein [Steroidobacteraceae bacterium]HRX89691.1 hypothetical protein [Steroidobacteraceae bacterium]